MLVQRALSTQFDVANKKWSKSTVLKIFAERHAPILVHIQANPLLQIHEILIFRFALSGFFRATDPMRLDFREGVGPAYNELVAYRRSPR
jgi:hypothetical protein